MPDDHITNQSGQFPQQPGAPPAPAAAYSQTNVTVQAAPSNGLGVAGFVTSLVGWVTCGLLCPIGLLMSLIALVKPPRGFAVAGVLIGGAGVAFMVLIGLSIIAGLFGLAGGIDAVQRVQTQLEAVNRIEVITHQTGSLPDDQTGTDAVSDLGTVDEPVAYRRISDDEYEIIHAGSDGIIGTDDDRAAHFDREGQPISGHTREP